MEAAAANHTHSSLEPLASISGSSQSAALKARFDSYKSSTPRNKLIDYYSSAMGNGALAMGYFLKGYDSSPYGGFFVCHYNMPRYVGIAGGTYYDHLLISDQNYTTYCVPKRSVLYNNTTGTNGTVTLSASAANYNHMRIYYRGDSNAPWHHSMDVVSPNGKECATTLVCTMRAEHSINFRSRLSSISGTSITRIYSTSGNVYAGTNSCRAADYNEIYITRVEAWNE